MVVKLLQDELSRRRDLRSECVFTIDPATARVLILYCQFGGYNSMYGME